MLDFIPRFLCSVFLGSFNVPSVLTLLLGLRVFLTEFKGDDFSYSNQSRGPGKIIIIITFSFLS